MQQSIQTRIPDNPAPYGPADLLRRRAPEEPTIRFEDVLGRELLGQGGKTPIMAAGPEVEARVEPVARQGDGMRVDSEGPAGRGERNEDANPVPEREVSGHDPVSASKNRPDEEKQAHGDAVRRNHADEKNGNTQGKDTDQNKAALAEPGKPADTPFRKASARKSLPPQEDGALSLLLRRVELLQSMLASSGMATRELREIRSALGELSLAAREKGRRFDRSMLEALGRRLRELAKKIDAHKSNTAGIKLESFRDGLMGLSETVFRLARKTDRKTMQGRMEEGGQPNARGAAFDRLPPANAAGIKDRHDAFSSKDGNTAPFGLHSGKAAFSHEKISQSPAQPMRNPLFEEQLQSLVRNARVVVQDAKNGSFQMRMYPESLGRVNVHLGLDQGTITGRFLVETAEARQALLEQLADVRDRLAESGISVGEFQVNVRGDERHARQSERDVPLVPLAGPAVEAGGVYEQQGILLHDGYIDVTI